MTTRGNRSPAPTGPVPHGDVPVGVSDGQHVRLLFVGADGIDQGGGVGIAAGTAGQGCSQCGFVKSVERGLGQQLLDRPATTVILQRHP